MNQRVRKGVYTEGVLFLKIKKSHHNKDLTRRLFY
jgi:hypothetical protein